MFRCRRRTIAGQRHTPLGIENVGRLDCRPRGYGVASQVRVSQMAVARGVVRMDGEGFGTMTDIWTVKAALDWTVGYLEGKGDENPRLSAEWLLSEACGLSRIELYVNFDRPLSMDDRDKLRGFVTRRGRGRAAAIHHRRRRRFAISTVKVRPGRAHSAPGDRGAGERGACPVCPPAKKRVALDSTIDAWEGRRAHRRRGRSC